MIEVRNLTKSYETRKAIQNISFSVQKGEVLGFLGPNGAGKSTTMKILSGFIPATSGSAVVNGFDVATEELKAKGSIGYLPETPPVYMNMEVEDYLRFTALLHGVDKRKVSLAVRDAMDKCGIVDVRSRIIGNLSKGYRQRVGLAQAIAHNPPVLILDEPTVGLDPRQIIDFRNMIKGLGGDHTVILSTHILPEVQATCNRVVVIDHGRVVAEDTLAGIAQKMQSSARLSVVVAKDPGAQLGKIRGVSGVSDCKYERLGGEHRLVVEAMKGHDVRAAVAEVCVTSGLGLLGLSEEKLSLEDAFVRLITSEEETLDMKEDA
jgi:ABC-2 type transport system ATP-binding protein